MTQQKTPMNKTRKYLVFKERGLSSETLVSFCSFADPKSKSIRNIQFDYLFIRKPKKCSFFDIFLRKSAIKLQNQRKSKWN